jgi:transcriptional regulator with XRE-family HTH domain
MLQRELADASSVSLRTITRLEVGGRAGLDTVRQLAAALRVEPSDLMGQPPAE